MNILYILIGLPILFFIVCFIIIIVMSKYYADINNVNFKEGIDIFEFKLKDLKESLEDRYDNY